MSTMQKCIRTCEIVPCIRNQYKGHQSTIRSLCFHPNVEILFSGNEDGSIMSWNYNEVEPKNYRFDGHTGVINDITLSTYGELMISASSDSTVRMWVPIATGEVITIKAHKSAVRSVCFNPIDNSVFATGSSDKTIKLWSTQNFKSTPKERKMKIYDFFHSFRDHKNWVHSVRFSPDGKLICSASDDKTIKIFDIRQKTCAISINNPVGRSYHAEFNPCGSTYIGVSADDSSFLIIDTRAKSVTQLYRNLFPAPINHFAFHPCGDFAVCVSQDAKIKVLDLNEAHPIFTLYGPRDALHAISFTPNGCLFATGGKDKEVLLWEHSMLPYKEGAEEFDGDDTESCDTISPQMLSPFSSTLSLGSQLSVPYM